jgi:hypothetical protein
MNVKVHSEKLKKFASKNNNSTIVISFRYLHFIDFEAMHVIRYILDSIAMERQSSQNLLKKRIVIMGLNKGNLDVFCDKEWIRDLHKNDMLIFVDPVHNEYFQS